LGASKNDSSPYEGGETVNAYCVKCKDTREINDPQAVKMKNGRPATTGFCSTCGTKMFRIGKAD
jgi:hypothetical protein